MQSVIEEKADGSTKQKELNTNTVKNHLVPIPPFKEQIRIVDKIDTTKSAVTFYAELHDKFESLNSELTQKLKASLLQEAIQGRLVPQIEAEGTAEELLAEIRAEKQQLVKEGKLKKSALNDSVIFRGDDNKYYLNNNGEVTDIDELLFDIPNSWSWVTLGELVSDSTGLSYKKDDLSDKSEPRIRVLRGGNIEDGTMSFKDDDVFISSKFVPSDLLLKEDTYISPAVSSLEKIGKTAMVTKNYGDVVVGGFVLMLSPTFSYAALKHYLYLFFQSPYYRNYCRTITKKSGQAFYNLSRQKLKQCPVPIPPGAEIQRINEFVEKALASIMSR